MSTDGYTEHKAVEKLALSLSSMRPLPALAGTTIWFGSHARGEGEWVSPEQAMEFAKAIESVVLSHNTRRGK
jgi:hypothetical protein